LVSDIVSQDSPARHRGLLALVIGLGVLIVMAVIAIVVVAVTRPGSAPAPSAAPAAQVFALPKGAVIVALESQPGRLILHLRTVSGEEIDILDTSDGHLVARIR
jgi:hypothetical protein